MYWKAVLKIVFKTELNFVKSEPFWGTCKLFLKLVISEWKSVVIILATRNFKLWSKTATMQLLNKTPWARKNRYKPNNSLNWKWSMGNPCTCTIRWFRQFQTRQNSPTLSSTEKSQKPTKLLICEKVATCVPGGRNWEIFRKFAIVFSRRIVKVDVVLTALGVRILAESIAAGWAGRTTRVLRLATAADLDAALLICTQKDADKGRLWTLRFITNCTLQRLTPIFPLLQFILTSMQLTLKTQFSDKK